MLRCYLNLGPPLEGQVLRFRPPPCICCVIKLVQQTERQARHCPRRVRRPQSGAYVRGPRSLVGPTTVQACTNPQARRGSLDTLPIDSKLHQTPVLTFKRFDGSRHVRPIDRSRVPLWAVVPMSHMVLHLVGAQDEHTHSIPHAVRPYPGGVEPCLHSLRTTTVSGRNKHDESYTRALRSQ